MTNKISSKFSKKFRQIDLTHYSIDDLKSLLGRIGAELENRAFEEKLKYQLRKKHRDNPAFN